MGRASRDSLHPFNSPAVLIHWRLLCFMMSKLSEDHDKLMLCYRGDPRNSQLLKDLACLRFGKGRDSAPAGTKIHREEEVSVAAPARGPKRSRLGLRCRKRLQRQQLRAVEQRSQITKENFDKHVLKCGHGQYTCMICIKHYLVNSGAADFQCDVCDKTFNQKYKLWIHQRVHKVESERIKDRFQCKFCDKTFAWKASLRQHLSTHSKT